MENCYYLNKWIFYTQPSGLLNLLESDEKAVESSEDHLNNRDNLQLVIDDMESLKPKGVQKLGLQVQKNLKVVEKHVEVRYYY